MPSEMQSLIGGAVYTSSRGREPLVLVTEVDGHLTGEVVEGVYVGSADLGPDNEYDDLATFLEKTDARYGDMLRRLAD
ncbi:MAG: hypothetical protein ACYTFI_10685 [Planctomycetota bacterium]|jgi:hypothetical protein